MQTFAQIFTTCSKIYARFSVSLQQIQNIMKKLLALLGFLLIMALVAGGAIYYLLFTCPFQHTEKAYIYIDTDDTADSIKNKIVETGNPRTMLGYELMCKLKSYGEKHRTGRYELATNATMWDLVRELRNGIQTPVKLVVPPARTIEKMTTVLSKNLMLDSLSLAQVLNDETRMKEVGGYSKETLPCLFIPETYEVYWDITPDKLVERLQKEKEKFWNANRRKKALEAKLTPDEVTTLASIVESETNYAPEKATVAGLYLNRLQRGIKLQSDPTVKFALQDFGLRRILFQHLEYDSPYNTYMYEGLPPGPICIPTPAGIDAVLNYERHKYLYMCAKEDFSGSHNFEETLSGHLINARRYQQALNARGIK